MPLLYSAVLAKSFKNSSVDASNAYGLMRIALCRSQCFPVPEGVADDIAAALPNPRVSDCLSLNWRAKLVPGETVLILGATGVTGKLAVQIAKLLGAGRVIVAGRNEQVLSVLHNLGADVTIRLDNQQEGLTEAFAREACGTGFQVIIDYVWGRPTEALLAAITRTEFAAVGTEARLVQVGESAGPMISLPAAVLRSTALTILGIAGRSGGETARADVVGLQCPRISTNDFFFSSRPCSLRRQCLQPDSGGSCVDRRGVAGRPAATRSA
jgi:NADPH:quinone reductase-like Zn-dependent oxidoreductase